MRHSAFTLLELMIVVAIIGFLATMAVPRYTAYFDKARQAEVALQLASLHAAQQSYYALHGKYSSKLAGPDSIGWQPEGYNGGGKNARFYYTYGFNVSGAQEGVHYFTGKLGAAKKALGKTHADGGSFCAAAAGKIARTGKHDVWTVDETRNVTQVESGI